MAFRGLFIGIDRYQSRAISWLNCAKRDAVALHALFSDTLGGLSVLLTDDQATRQAIEQQIDDLATCDPDDVVVIAFSGHGSDTHELVTHDADLSDLRGSCIPLETLREWFARIPATRVVCFLDCCFSGGIGAKVLHAPAVSRSLTSVATLLDQLSGAGKLIFTASSANEEAWETQKYGHGLLTHYLIESLQGAEEVRQAGKISVLRFLEYVTQRVKDSAVQLGKPQNPTIRGMIDGELTWPIFTPGPLYRAAFPERSRSPVIADIASLAPYGFPQPLLDAWAGSIPSLNQLQMDAINSFGLLDGEHLVVSAPTSSGKTMVGELAALKGVLNRQRALFLVPLKALVNDKHQEFNRRYGSFGVRTIRATGEIVDDIPALMRGQYDICLMTYEKFTALALIAPHILNQLGTVVVDEVQMIADTSRGVNLEFLLTLLRMRRRQGIEPQLIALSAVIGDTNGLERWLGARLLRRTERPIPLDEGIITADGTFRFIDPDGNEQRQPGFMRRAGRKDSSQDWIIPLLRRLIAERKQIIVFRETRGEARGCARYLASELGLPPAQAALDALPSGDPSVASQALREALAGGVAFHISDLDRDERLAIEEQFRAPDTKLRVIAATTTLAMGVNTPASAVVIAGLEHPNGPYSIAEYKNIVGRAGRLGFAERGQSFLLALSAQEEHQFWQRYVLGTPEDLESRFLAEGTDPRSLVLRVLVAAQRAAGHGLSEDEIVEFLEASFGAFQQISLAENWVWDRDLLIEAIDDLARHLMVERDADDAILPTPLGRLAGEAGVEVESIIRVVEVFGRLDPQNLNDQALVATTQLTVELDSIYFPINTRSTQKEPPAWLNELTRQAVPAIVVRALQMRATDQQQITRRSKKAVACLLWMTDLPMAQVENILTQHGGRFDGIAGPVRAIAARAVDLLPTVGRVAELLHAGLDLGEGLSRLLVRLEVGVPSSAVDLARQTGNRLTRGDFRQLMQAGQVSIDAIEASPDDALLACVGGDQAKLADLRRAVEAHRLQEASDPNQASPLPLYQP